jgi:hypothetical protein
MRVLVHGFAENELIIEGLEQNVGKSNVDLFVPPLFGKNARREYRPDDVDRYDLIVFGYGSFFDKDFGRILGRKTGATKIYVDTVDSFFVRRIYTHPEISYYFKRELCSTMGIAEAIEWSIRFAYGDYLYTPLKLSGSVSGAGGYWHPMNLPYRIAVANGGKLRPFPLMVHTPNRRIGLGKRDIDLSFTLKLNTIADRARVFNYLHELREHYPKSSILIGRGDLEKGKYYEVLARSKSSISVRGYGYDTWRYWEIPAFGSALVSQRSPLIIPNNFVDGESALFFGNEEELRIKFRRYVAKSDEWMEIARNGNGLFRKHHTPQKRVRELILDQIKV